MGLALVVQEGEGYLDRTLTEWKKPELMTHFDGGEEEEEEEEVEAKKPKLSKYTTMKGTAKVCHMVVGLLQNLQHSLNIFLIFWTLCPAALGTFHRLFNMLTIVH